MTKRALEKRMLALLEERGTATACPSEVARAVEPDGDWRALMPEVREAAARLREKGLVEAYQQGRPVDPLAAKGPIRLRAVRAAALDYRRHPDRYRIGRGEEGVLTVEPYKSELLPLWRFRTAAVAESSARALRERFEKYAAEGDFVGMDMARKYLQMGWTRARRYANHKGGRKWAKGEVRTVLPLEHDEEKARAAAIFKRVYDEVRADPRYLKARERHAQKHVAGK